MAVDTTATLTPADAAIHSTGSRAVSDVPPGYLDPRPARRRPRWRPIELDTATVAAAVALVVMLLCGFAIVLMAAAGPSWLSPVAARGNFPSWINGPLAGLAPWLALSPRELNIVFGVLAGLMYVGYLVVVAGAPRLRAGWVVGFIVLLHLVFLLAPPMQLSDIFNYLNYARMEVVHGLNPYTTIPALEPMSDPTFALSNWHGLLNPYGPLFTLFSFALVPMGVVAAFWGLKATLVALSLATVALVWRCAELLGRDPRSAAAFVGLNPIVLIWGIGGDHNDFFMVFLIVLATYLIVNAQTARVGLREPPPWNVGAARRAFRWLDGTPHPLPIGEPGPAREFGAGVAIMAAVAIKASAGILIPIVVLGVRRRMRLAAGLLVGFAAAAAATIVAFGVNLPNLAQQGRLVAQSGIPNLIGNLAGAGGETGGLHAALSVVTVAGVLACALWAGRSRDWITAVGLATLLVLVTLSWILPSYLLWLLPLAALAPGRWLRIATIVFAVYVFIFWMPYTDALERWLHLHLGTTGLAQAASSFQNSLEF